MKFGNTGRLERQELEKIVEDDQVDESFSLEMNGQSCQIIDGKLTPAEQRWNQAR